jgi:uncharacterized protein YidB (DUF937 family)
MANQLIGAVLGRVFANAMRGRAAGGPFASTTAPAGGGLGDLLGGLLSGTGAPAANIGAGRSPLGGKHSALVAMMLPFALRWVQRNGGLGALLQKLEQKGYGPHATTWISSGANRSLDANAAREVIGGGELSQLAHHLGVPQQEVEKGMAEILPELVDQLTPEGKVPAEADEALGGGLHELERQLSQLTTSAPV